MKTLGIIGGLGPETTANFYMEVILACAKFNKRHRPSIIIVNVPIGFELEKNFIKHSRGKKQFLALLIEAAIRLEKGGADFIVIPCNTAHIFIEEVRNAVDIPVLSIIDEAVDHLKKKRIKSVGLLATPSTIKNKLFNSKLKVSDIQAKLPDDLDQLRLGNIINRILENSHDLNDKNTVMEIIDHLSCESILLACTDLHILIPNGSNSKVFDTMQILKDATLRELIN